MATSKIRTRKEIVSEMRKKQAELKKLKDSMKLLYIESLQICDKKSYYEEKEETRGRGKHKTTDMVGRIHWSQYFADGDTGKKFKIERSREVRTNGVWDISNIEWND